MEDIQTEYICVDLEEVDGKKRIKRLEDGSHPLDVLGRVLAEENEEYKAANNGMPLLDWAVVKEAGSGGQKYHVFRLTSLENGQRKTVRQLILIDNATGEPVPTPINIPSAGTGMKSMARRDTLEQVGQVFDFERARSEAQRRGVQIRAGSSWSKLEKAKRELEA